MDKKHEAEPCDTFISFCISDSDSFVRELFRYSTSFPRKQLHRIQCCGPRSFFQYSTVLNTLFSVNVWRRHKKNRKCSFHNDISRQRRHKSPICSFPLTDTYCGPQLCSRNNSKGHGNRDGENGLSTEMEAVYLGENMIRYILSIYSRWTAEDQIMQQESFLYFCQP